MKAEKGFTLVELIIVIVIISILSIVSVQAYRGYVRKSIATEAKVLLSEVNAAEQIYYSRNGSFYSTTLEKDKDKLILGVNPEKNKYFTSYTATVDGDTFRVVTQYDGKSLTLDGSLSGEPTITDNFS